MGPLAHLTILDLSRIPAGPWCTQLLGRSGRPRSSRSSGPGAGDDTRAWGPPFLKDARRPRRPPRPPITLRATAASFRSPSISRDPKASASSVIWHLRRDVLVENFKVGGLGKYGLDYASMSALNPRLVYASITGFGQDGPYADRAGYDFIIQGMSGFMSVTGERDDLPGGGPQKAGVAITDLMTGMYAAVAILAALAHRDRTGGGSAARSGPLRFRGGDDGGDGDESSRSRHAPGARRQCAPEYRPVPSVRVRRWPPDPGGGNDGQLAKFCELPAMPEWARDERFARNENRVRHRATLVPMVAEVIAKRPQQEWLAARKPSACLAGRSTGWTRSSPIRNCRRGACCSTWRIRWPAGFRRSIHRSGCRGRRFRRPAAAAAGRTHAAGAARAPGDGRCHEALALPPRASSRSGSHERHHAQAGLLDRLLGLRADVSRARIAAVPAGDTAHQPGHQARAA